MNFSEALEAMKSGKILYVGEHPKISKHKMEFCRILTYKENKDIWVCEFLDANIALGVEWHIYEEPKPEPKPEPTHDFTWALEKRKEGRTVTRAAWKEARMEWPSTCIGAITDTLRYRMLHTINDEDYYATDWEVVE